MLSKALFFILPLLLSLPSLSYQQQQGEQPALEKEKHLNFIAAIQNRSTFSYFTVIKAINLNTGEVKEICTSGNFVLGALHTELRIGFDAKGARKVLEYAKAQQDRCFEFKSIAALDNISFFDYDSDLLAKLQASQDFERVFKEIERDKAFSIRLEKSEMKAFAHVLFNHGYLTGENNCFGGELQYVNREAAKR